MNNGGPKQMMKSLGKRHDEKRASAIAMQVKQHVVALQAKDDEREKAEKIKQTLS